MKATKTILGDLYRCYGTMAMELEGRLHYFFASEEKGYPCYAYDAHDLSSRKVVWEKGGGTMSMIPHPTKTNTFLAVMDFYLKETPSLSRLVMVEYAAGVFKQTDLIHLPFLHRFDVFHIEGKIWIIAATIAQDKADKEDWSRPGEIHIGQLEGTQLTLQRFGTGFTRNHGYFHANDHSGYFSCDEGIYHIAYDHHRGWEIKKMMEGRIGEIAVADINQDGQDEWITIEPFHGNAIQLYEHTSTRPTSVFDYPKEIDFAHTLISIKLQGKACFAGGIRRIHPDLFVLSHDQGAYRLDVIDEAAGPANIAYVNDQGQDLILAANHTSNQAALYVLESGDAC